MSFAKGTLSRIYAAQQNDNNDGYNPLVEAGYFPIAFRSETLSSSIGKIQSDEIRGNRKRGAIRGGNKLNGGNITTELSMTRHWGLWMHLLGYPLSAGDSFVPVPGGVGITTVATAVTAGLVYSSGASPVRAYVCIKPGTTAAAPITGTTGIIKSGTAEFVYIGSHASAPPVAIGSDAMEASFEPQPNLNDLYITLAKLVSGAASGDLWTSYVGCKIASLGINVQQEGIVTADWNFAGMRTIDYGNTPVITDNVVALTPEAPFKGSEVRMELVGSGLRKVQTASININNGIDESVLGIGNRERLDLPEGTLDVTGSVTCYFEDRTEYDAFMNETAIGLKFHFFRDNGYMGMYLPKVKLSGDPSPKTSGPGVISLPFSFDATCEDDANDKLFQLVIRTKNSDLWWHA